jgi:Mg-chelatase subunit ChlI
MESTLEKLASKSLIIAGETGTKKTRLAKAIARLAFDDRYLHSGFQLALAPSNPDDCGHC